MQVSRLVTKAETRLVPLVSKPQCFVKVYLPALPPGDLGVMEVPLLEGQSVVISGVGVDVDVAERVEVVCADVVDGVAGVDELLDVSIRHEEVHRTLTSAHSMTAEHCCCSSLLMYHRRLLQPMCR
jgi:hypothetical protein